MTDDRRPSLEQAARTAALREMLNTAGITTRALGRAMMALGDDRSHAQIDRHNARLLRGERYTTAELLCLVRLLTITGWKPPE